MKLNSAKGFKDLYAYQQTGARWLASRNAALFAWDMGTGKTPTSVVAADLINAQRIVIVCPAIARGVWADAMSMWARTKRAIYVVRSARASLPPPSSDTPCAVIVSYDLLAHPKSSVLKQLIEMGQAQPFDLLICDEAHALKSPEANRTRAIYGRKIDGQTGLASLSGRVWALTGTPVLNAAHEVWTHLHALAPDAIMNNRARPMAYSEFVQHFCTTRNTIFGMKITGSRNQTELNERMGAVTSRVRLSEVIDDMPPLTCAIVPVTIGDAKIPADVLRELRAADALARAEFGPSLYSTDLASDADDFLASLRAAQFALASERRLTGLAKAPIVADLVRQDLMGNDQKIIVFAHHKAVIDALAEALADLGVVVVDGRTSDRERDQRVRDFQADPAVRVFVGQLQACATAVTLTAAHNVVFAEADWTPALNHQAACRAHRIGQKHPVLARFVVLEGTLDARIMRLLARKTQEIAAIMGGNENPLGLASPAASTEIAI